MNEKQWISSTRKLDVTQPRLAIYCQHPIHSDGDWGHGVEANNRTDPVHVYHERGGCNYIESAKKEMIVTCAKEPSFCVATRQR